MLMPGMEDGVREIQYPCVQRSLDPLYRDTRRSPTCRMPGVGGFTSRRTAICVLGYDLDG